MLLLSPTQSETPKILFSCGKTQIKIITCQFQMHHLFAEDSHEISTIIYMVNQEMYDKILSSPEVVIVGIRHDFSCINICWGPGKLFEHKTDRLNLQ